MAKLARDQPPIQAREAGRRSTPKKRAALIAIDRGHARPRTRTATRRGSSCRRCPATPIRRACATAALITGRPRGMFSKFGLGRNKMREYRDARGDPRHGQGQLVKGGDDMSMSDPIADMLTRIRNAQHGERTVVAMPSSKVKMAIAQVLKDEGYIDGFSVVAARSGEAAARDRAASTTRAGR